MAVLSEVIDGTTPITETHPEEKRAAIGTTWDSASDMTLKEVSDSFPIDQSDVDLTSMAMASGKATRYDEFTVDHLPGGGHRTTVAFVSAQSQVDLGSAAAAAGDAVRYDEFTQEHAAGGGHSANIIDQDEINLTSLADASGEAVRYDEFTVDHLPGGGHRTTVEFVTAQTQVNLGSAAAATGDAVRYDEFTSEHSAGGGHSVPQATATGDAVRWDDWNQQHTNAGAHRADVTIITAQSQIGLNDMATASGDATRYDEFTQDHLPGGGHRTTVEFVTAQAQVNLGSAAAATGDAVRYDEFTQEHQASGAHATTGWLVDNMVNGSAAITGTKVNAATTSTRGTVELAESTESDASLVVQANDVRLRRKIIYADSSVATGVSGNQASPLAGYSMDDPGSNDSEDKIYVVYYQDLDPGQDYVTLVYEASVSQSPYPSEASVQVYITQDGSPAATNSSVIDSYGSMAYGSVQVDVSGLDTGINLITVRLVWTSSSSSGETAYLRRCILYTGT